MSYPEVEALQSDICLISEMFHTSSLYHDDVIDKAATRCSYNFMADCKMPQDICRRGKESVNSRWNQCYSVFAGDFILATSSAILARTKNPEVGNKSPPEYSLHLSPKGDREYVSSSGRSCGGRVSADDHEVEKHLVDCFDLIHFEGETTRTDSIFIWRRVTTKLPALLRIPANLLLFYLQTA